MTEADSRSVILARRARFIAAALASSGIGVSTIAALGGEAEAQPPTEAEESPPPRICLSDDLVEGTLDAGTDAEPEAEALEVPREQPPHVCLSIEPPGSERHDGVYLRMGAGPGLLGMSVGDGAFEESGSGLALQLDLAAGISLSQSLAIAFGVTGFYAPSLENERLGSGTFWRLGPVIDWFFLERLGLHGSLSFGPMYFGVERTRRGGAHGIGFGAGLWLGYDAWISDSWALGLSVGGMAGFGGGLNEERDAKLNARAISILLSILRN